MEGSPVPDPPTQSTSTNPLAAGAQFKPKSTTTSRTFLSEFWTHVTNHAEGYEADFKDCQIPLARIKKLMKTDPEINVGSELLRTFDGRLARLKLQMVATEVSVLLDKACEIFINEITVRAFLVANASNRRTVLKGDIAAAISKSEMFDFLIDIVPGQEEPTLDDAPASPTSPTSNCAPFPPKPSKKRARPFAPSSPIQPDPKLKKRKGPSRPNRNLLPEEVAVPIPEAERIAQHQRSEAVPIPDSELATPTWDLAVPMSQNGQRVLSPLGEEEEKPEIDGPGDWEIAVPIDQADPPESPSPSPPWEMAVPISGAPNPSAPHQSPSAARTWERAIPITQPTRPTDQRLTVPQQNLTWEKAVPISPPNSNPVPRHPKGWELAVPIVEYETECNRATSRPSRLLPHERAVPIEQSPSPAPSSPSQRTPHHFRPPSTSSSRDLLIDPALLDMKAVVHDRRPSTAQTSAFHRTLSGPSAHVVDHTIVVKEEEAE
ncbi:hypothetical protein CROQUDRAFT_95459 [Cronartium quercuum f. sp. fusiforme G11]|uniref:Transcription factor CBF/NF-Y/archaeal histone domain-containing protein n=1 Tax=Cronartium quercuum f. sp. fusiforme G11 TaxID=708437 RepID=A0A9P6NEC9_9BASI|nr:hypothetical protein CROQUDRAFT_95459 [Cronartium quercuum f. sp. fusiforme G11]